MTINNKDKEQEKLIEKIKQIVGIEELKKINNIVDLSYQFDEFPEYKIDFRIIK